MNFSPATSRLCRPHRILLRRVNIDTWTGLIAGDACKDFVKDDLVMNVSDKWGRHWLRSGAGRDWLEAHDMPRNPFFAPDRECSASDPRPVLQFSNFNDGTVVTETNAPIQGVIDVKNGGFTGWRLEYGAGPDPAMDSSAQGANNAFLNPSLIYTWDLSNIHESNITLRLYLSNGEDYYAERRVTITLNLPTPTPSITPSPTPFPDTAVPTDTSFLLFRPKRRQASPQRIYQQRHQPQLPKYSKPPSSAPEMAV